MYFVKLITFYFCVGVFTATVEPCKTPNDEFGECILLQSCPRLLKMIKENTITSLEFVRNSICGFEGINSKVCCRIQLNSTDVIVQKPEDENGNKESNKHLLPNKRYCGYQHSDDYVHDTNDTKISEFPWLARLGYKRSKSPDSYVREYNCLGSLINVRYVLTSAICVSVEDYVIMEVQLGEYHLFNDTDCVSDYNNIEECSDPIHTYGIEEIVVHPNFDIFTVEKDIALLRMNSSVVYSDYIRPICLPYPGTVFASIGDTLTTSGWGFINIKLDKAIIKKKVLGTLLSNDECAEEFDTLIGKPKPVVTKNRLCTQTFQNSTELNCHGDSGAPVIFSYRMQWHQEGIVSTGEGSCGIKYPEVHTRVEKYLGWIETNIKP